MPRHQQNISCMSDEIFGAMLTILALGLISMAKCVSYEAKYERLQVSLTERSLNSFFCLFHTDMATVRSGYVARSRFSAVNREWRNPVRLLKFVTLTQASAQYR
jgi:hypothetical protein